MAQRVRIHSQGIPVRKVVAELRRRTGIPLQVDGAAGDERLVAFVPDAPVAEVLRGIADLYRLTWQREGGASPAYRLVKPTRAAHEEQRLRDRSLQDLLTRLGERLRNPNQAREGPPGRARVWQPIFPALFPIMLARGNELVREGYANLPIAALPPAHREALLDRMRPILRGEDDRRTVALNEIRRQEIEMGIPEQEATLPKPASNAEKCVFTVALHIPGPPRASLGLRTDAETWYNWLEIDGDALVDESLASYSARGPRVPEPGPPAAFARADDPLHRPIRISGENELRKGDWISGLARLSHAARVSIYADCYASYQGGYAAHPRAQWTLAATTNLAQALDGLCRPTIFVGGTPRSLSNSFWWQEHQAVMIRSRRWLWDQATMLPSNLTDHLTTSIRATGRLAPEDLVRLGSLRWAQVQALESNGRQLDGWNAGVRLPARLTAAARAQLVSGKLLWGRLGPADRQVLAPLMAPPPPDRDEPSAMIRTDLREVPEQGAVLALVSYWPMGDPHGRTAYFALPGIDLKLQPRGLTVESIE